MGIRGFGRPAAAGLLFMELAFLALLVPALPAQASNDSVQISLTYKEKNGLAAPCGRGDFAMGGSQACLAGASLLMSFNSIGSLLEDAMNGKAVPKTTGELMRQTMDNEATRMAARVPRKTGYQGTLEATMEWDAKKRLYVVKSGTYTWSSFNDSEWRGGEHDLFSKLTASGTHKLEPGEVTIRYNGTRMSEALGPKAASSGTYTLELNLKPEPQPAIGTSGWIVDQGKAYDVRERYTADGIQVQTTTVSTYRDSDKRPPEMFEYKPHYKAEDRELKNGKGRFSEEWLEPTGAHAAIAWTVYREGDLVADPGGPYVIERDGEVAFDASRSKGQIDRYLWTFTALDESGAATTTGQNPPIMAMAAAPASGGKGAGAKQAAGKARRMLCKEGKTVKMKVYGELEVTVRVEGPAGSDEATIQPTIEPRTGFATVMEADEEGDFPTQDAETALVKNHTLLPVIRKEKPSAAAFHFCALDAMSTVKDWKKADHILHFEDCQDIAKEWEGKAYDLEQISEPGLWCKLWRVKQKRFVVKRKCYISPYYTKDTLVVPGGAVSWIKANEQRRAEEIAKAKANHTCVRKDDFNSARFVEATLKHEHTHCKILRDELKKPDMDPGMIMEKMLNSDQGAIKRELKDLIGTANRVLNDLGNKLDGSSEAFSYESLWSGQIRVFDETSSPNDWTDSSDSANDIWGSGPMSQGNDVCFDETEETKGGKKADQEEDESWAE